jgi:hypothetical protein
LTSIREQDAVLGGKCRVEVVCVSPAPIRLGPNAQLFESNPMVDVTVLEDEGCGLYSALAQSFPQHTGEFHSYLGAGDVYESQAFTVVTDILSKQVEDPAWVTGMVTTRRQDGAIVRATLPYRYSPRAFRRGLYGRLTPGIQQESTWWTTRLHQQLPLDALAQFKLAGDLFMWTNFSRTVSPLVVESVLSSFWWHGDNMSQDWSGYLAEVESIFGAPSPTDRIMAKTINFQWALPNRIKVRFGRGEVLRWSWPDGPWQGR